MLLKGRSELFFSCFCLVFRVFFSAGAETLTVVMLEKKNGHIEIEHCRQKSRLLIYEIWKKIKKGTKGGKRSCLKRRFRDKQKVAPSSTLIRFSAYGTDQLTP